MLMKKKRLIPVLLLQNGSIVKSKGFSRYQRLGNPITSVKRLSEWASDELIYLDITKNGGHDLKRDDLAFNNRTTVLEIIKDVSAMTFMPITVGGNIKTLEDVELRLKAGADKIAINTMALERPNFIGEIAREFGTQCVVVSIDHLENSVYSHVTKSTLDIPVLDWAKQVADEGAGEILLNAVARDGMQTGYDIETLQGVAESVNIPIIACGGVGEWAHMAECLDKTKVDAVAAANIFHYSDQSVYIAKKYLYDKGYMVRNPELLKIDLKEMENAVL